MSSIQHVSPLKSVSGNPPSDDVMKALTSQPFPTIQDRAPHAAVPTAGASAILSALHAGLATDANPAILFTSAYGSEGAPTIAFHSARAAAEQSPGNVLYIHASEHIPEFFFDIEGKIPVTLTEFVRAGGGEVLPFVLLEDSGLVCTHLRQSETGLAPKTMTLLMAALRSKFEVTVIGGDEMLAGGASSAFPGLVDGTIVVTEAERTRAPVAKKLKKSIEEYGGHVWGAILNRRRYYIPGWLYGALYGRRR
ncbi:MAG: hypothetical protein EOM26_07715 [Alphaproteobacteria bacterium]|nr:hypothetical protein [Alphaproteobacteria bacterium]